MSKKTFALLLSLFLLASLLGACRRHAEEATPTTAAAAATSTSSPAASATTRPATATATSEAVADDDAGLEPLTLDPATIDWSPQVVQSSPRVGEEALLDGAITIRFDQPMDQKSVESAFTIAAGGDDAVEGQFEWPQENVLVFTPASRLERNQNYRVQISQQAAARSGRSLQEPVELQFETVGTLEVAQVIPATDADDVDTDASITVLFNRPVVPLVSSGQQAQLPDPIQFDPPLAGEGDWVSTSIYRFTPDSPLAGATTYQATIPAGLEGVMGAVLEDDYSWTFTTLDPSVATIVPGTGAEEVAPTQPFTVTFNMPMDRSSVESAVSLQPAAPLAFEWSEDSRSLYIEHDGLLELGTRYTLTVGDSATAASGQATLDRETGSSFTTVPSPAVVRTSPGSNEEAPRYQFGVHIEFSAPMDPETIEGRVQIEPAPVDEPDYFIHGKNVNIDFPLADNTTYEVTIPADVADPYGNTLGEPYTWQFTTPPPAPVVSLNLPAPISQISDNHPTTVDVVYRNVSSLDAALYDLGMPIELLIEPYRVNEFTPGGEPLRTWSQSLEAPENSARSTALNLAGDGDSLAPGVYYLRATAPEITEDVRYWQNQRSLLIIADTNLVVKEMFGSVYVWATDLASAEPVSGRSLTLYNANGVEIGSAATDAQGLARFDYQPPRDYLPGVLVVSGEPGAAGFGVGSSNWNSGTGPWQFSIPATTSGEPPEFAYIYTDRPIYRPGDTVHFRGILRDSNYGRYNLPGREQVTVQVEPVSFSEPSESLTYEETLTVDENGTFAGDFILPEDAQLSQYRIYLSQQGEIARANREFTVADYRRPEFIVSVTPTQDEVVRGETVEVTVEARYFFGAPATDLPVEWTVRELNYTLPWQGSPYYSFDDDDSFVFDYGQNTNFFGNFVREGSGRTDEDGRLVITLPADLLADVEAGSRRVTVEATIRDLSEFPVSARGEIVYHAAETYVGIAPANYLGQAGEETAVELITLDWEMDPVPGQEVDVVFYEREYEYVPDDRFGSRFGTWEPVDTEVARTTVTTDEDGETQANFVPESGGTYRALATVADGAGNTHTSSTLFWVSDSDFVTWRVNPEEKRMDLTPDQRTYEVGDTARILVQSPFAGPVNAWLTIERGELLEQRLITLESNSEVVEIPISESFSPNAFVTIVAIKGSGDDGDFADIRLGITELVVPPDRLELDISLTPQGDLLSPGETVTYDIRVTDYAGQPVQADLSLALVDLAVLTLQEDNAPPIAEAFYERQPYRSEIGSGLFVRGEGLEVEIPEEVLGLGGGGGGGDELAMAGDRAVEEEDEPGVRQDFPDTAFWQASLVTDSNGQATVEIPLPDTLTTWRLSSKAVTADSLVGQTSVDVVATLPLLVRPVTPRFFTVNDVVQLGAVVNNNSSETLDVAVSLEAEGVTLADPVIQELSIPAGSQQLVRWEVTVEDVEFVDLTFRVEGGDYSDVTKPTFGVGPSQLIPVYRYDAEDIVGTSGVLVEAGQQVEAILLPPQVDPREGLVAVRLNASLAASLLETLDYVNDLEIDQACAHGVVNQLLPNLATARAFRTLGIEDAELEARLDELVQAGINRLAQLQKGNGGWGWCYTATIDEYLTAYVLYGLAQAEQAGYDLGDIDVNSALRRLPIRDAGTLTDAWAANRQAWFLYVLAEWGAVDVADLDALFEEQRELLDPYAHAYLTLAHEVAGIDSDNQEALLSDLSNSAVVSAAGAHWEDASRDWRNLSSNIRGTAVVIDALTAADPESPLAANAVRWLMSARQASHWTTPFETAWSVIALTDWMATSGELDADFNYAFAVNGAVQTSGTFAEGNIAETEAVSVPLRRLPQDEVNFLIFDREEGPGRLYYTAYLDAYIDAEAVDPVSSGFTVERTYYDAECDPETETCEPLTTIEAGQRVRVELTVVTANDRTFVRVEDPLPAGAEAVDPGLSTSATGFGGEVERVDTDNGYRPGYWGWWFFNRIEYRDEKVVFYSDFLPAGTYQYSYTLETPIPGEYQVRPAVAYEEFFPDVFGRSAGKLFTIAE